MTHVESANDVAALHNIVWYKSSPYNATMGSGESLIMEPRSTPSSTPILVISNSLVVIRNC